MPEDSLGRRLERKRKVQTRRIFMGVFILFMVFLVAGASFYFFDNQFSKGNQHNEFNSLFVGAGYSQPLGGRAYLDLLILFNLNDTYNSPYSNPIFRVGFGFGL